MLALSLELLFALALSPCMPALLLFVAVSLRCVFAIFLLVLVLLRALLRNVPLRVGMMFGKLLLLGAASRGALYCQVLANLLVTGQLDLLSLFVVQVMLPSVLPALGDEIEVFALVFDVVNHVLFH